jgi:hypothetical protein
MISTVSYIPEVEYSVLYASLSSKYSSSLVSLTSLPVLPVLTQETITKSRLQ